METYYIVKIWWYLFKFNSNFNHLNLNFSKFCFLETIAYGQRKRPFGSLDYFILTVKTGAFWFYRESFWKKAT